MVSRPAVFDTSTAATGNRRHENAAIVWPDPSPLTSWWTDHAGTQRRRPPPRRNGRDEEDLERACLRVSEAAGESVIGEIDWCYDDHDVALFATLALGRGPATTTYTRWRGEDHQCHRQSCGPSKPDLAALHPIADSFAAYSALVVRHRTTYDRTDARGTRRPRRHRRHSPRDPATPTAETEPLARQTRLVRTTSGRFLDHHPTRRSTEPGHQSAIQPPRRRRCRTEPHQPGTRNHRPLRPLRRRDQRHQRLHDR